MAAMIHVDKIYDAEPVLVWLGVLDLTTSLYYLFYEKRLLNNRLESDWIQIEEAEHIFS